MTKNINLKDLHDNSSSIQGHNCFRITSKKCYLHFQLIIMKNIFKLQ